MQKSVRKLGLRFFLPYPLLAFNTRIHLGQAAAALGLNYG